MKTRMKRFISLVCVLTVFASAVLSTNFLSAEATSGQATTLPSNMTEITFRDFPLKIQGKSTFEDGTYTKWNYGKYEGTTMDNTLFSGTITFPQDQNAMLMYAGKEYYQGLQFIPSKNGSNWELRLRDSGASKDVFKFTPSVAGVELVGTPLELDISVNYVDHDNGGTNNDVKLGVWFGGKLYNEEYIYIDNLVDSTKVMGPYLTFLPTTAGMTMKSAVRLPRDMEEINFTDFGIENGSYDNTVSGTYAGTTMDKTLFSGKITFSETGETHLMYGGTRAWAGFILTNVLDTATNEYYLRLYDSNADKNDGGSKKFNDVKFLADKAELDTFVGKEFALNLTIEYVNNDNGATKNDLKLGVWFNKKLYDNQYIYINNYVDNGHSIGNTMTIWNRNGAVFELESFNYQLPKDMTEITFRDFGIADGEYTKWKGQTYAGETMDNTLFGGTITFPKVVGAQLSYAGKENYTGIELVVSQKADTNEWTLRLRENKNKAFKEVTLYSDVAGVELVGVPLELNISIEYVNIDEGTTNNDVKLGVWFGGKLYNDAYMYIENFVDAPNAIGNWLTYIPKTGGPIQIQSSDLKMPTDMQHLSFRDFGFADGTLTTAINNGEYEGETMNNTLFRGNVTYSTAGTSHIAFGGKGSLQGFLLANMTDGDGNNYLRLWDSNADKSGKKFNDYNFYEDEAGVPLVGTKLDLAISMEFVNNDNGSTENDLKLGVWFAGKLYRNTYIYINNYVDTGHSIGQYMTIWNQTAGATVTIESVGEINWKPLPEGLTEITYRDFGYVDGNVTGYPAKQYEGENLDNTLFSGKITFPETSNVFMQYGGKEAGTGINLGTAYNEDEDEWYLRLFNAKKASGETNFAEQRFYADVARVDELVGEEITLNITTQFVEHDGDGAKNDVKIGVWFNGKLYNNNYIYLDDYADATYSMGNYLSFYAAGGSKVNIKSVGTINWKPLPEGMTEITYRDFGYVDGNVTGYPAKQYEGENLDNTLFSGKITFPETSNVFMQYGGKEAGTGINLGTAYNEDEDEWYLRLFNAKKASSKTNFAEQRFYADVARVDALVGEEIALNITVQYVEHDGDGAKNDVKLGVWFNGKLYNNNYIYLDDYADATYSMGNYLSFYAAGGSKVNIKSVGTINWKPMPEGLTEITFRDFGFIDGGITQYPKGEYEGTTLDNTIFTGKITFPESEAAHLIYGGKTAGGGFDIVPAKDTTTGEWHLRLFDTNADKSGKKFEYKFLADVAGVPLVGEEVALSLSLQYVDHDKDGVKDDVKLGVWFGGKLYNNNYIYLDNFVDTGHSMGTWMSFSVVKTSKILIESVGETKWKPLPTGFKELGFKDFGFKAGTYEGGTKSGTCELESMDKTLFSGIIMYSTVGETHFTYGGKKGLSGLDFVNVKDEKTGEHYIRLFDTNADKSGKKFNDMYFYSDVAGVTLVGEELDIKLSIEYVNHDGGKTVNDLKLGVWFAGKLYNNRYIYIDNYVDTGHSIGSYMTVWVRNGATFNVGRVSDWLDWSAFGLTADWKKTLLDTDFNLSYTLAGGNLNTGDFTTAPYLMMSVSLAVVVLCGFQIVRRRQEENDMQG